MAYIANVEHPLQCIIKLLVVDKSQQICIPFNTHNTMKELEITRKLLSETNLSRSDY